jgi:hypothetical protein
MVNHFFHRVIASCFPQVGLVVERLFSYYPVKANPFIFLAIVTGLEGVFYGGDAPAQGQDHRTMPPHQGLKRVLIPDGQKSLQQLVIRLGGKVRIDDQAVDEFDYSMHFPVWHWSDSPMKLFPSSCCEKLRRASRFFLISTQRFRKARRLGAVPLLRRRAGP